ncbi:MAG: DUF4178 domain-containing protein [Thermosynechococcaceae cyanobacterium]
MPGSVTDATLQSLNVGDRLTYFGVRWQVCDQSTYTDPKGYAMEEWLLKSTTGKEYYLLREMDPANASPAVHWYIAEELLAPQIYDPTTQVEVLTVLARQMRSGETPYPQLQLFNRLYQFESQTQGTYETESCDRDRITWDYWDAAHLWNLALEAWSGDRLVVYSTREVQPEDFSDYRPAQGLPPFRVAAVDASPHPLWQNAWLPRQQQLMLAWGMVLFGFFLMLMGV